MSHAIIDILGENYTIRGDMEVRYIAEVGRLVDERMRELYKNFPQLNAKRLAVLTAINLADELLQERMLQEEQDVEPQVARRTSELICLLDEGLTASSPL